ncbi:MAG: IclR family transcriptional regulator [Propioniciclava sp.]
MRTAGWTDSVSVLDRVTAILEAFGNDEEGLGVTELARRANLPKSTVSRLVADLVGRGYLDRDGNKIHLGVRLFELGQLVSQPRELRRASLPIMADLRSTTRETVHLAVLEGAEVVYVAVLRGRSPLGPMSQVGARRPAHSTALGKALLAVSSPTVVDRVLGTDLAATTPETVTDPIRLRRELTEFRRAGVATESGETVPGVACAAAPILSYTGEPLAALSVSGAADEFPMERIVHAVTTASGALSRKIGSRVSA